MKDEIDDLINEVDDETEVISFDETDENYIDEKKNTELEVDLDEKNELSNRIVQNSLDVIENAKKVFDNFSADVILGKDRSTSSKEMLISSLGVQNDANKNLINLAKVLKDQQNSNNTNILIGEISSKKTGVSYDNLDNYFDSEDDE